MALALVQHKSGHSVVSATTVDVTVTSTGASALLVVTCSSAGNHTVNTVTDNIGNTYTQGSGAAANGNAGADRTDIWYCLSATAAVTTVTITFNGAAGTFVKDGEVFEVSGFLGATFDTAAVTNDVSDGGVSVITGASVTTATTNGFAVGVFKGQAGATINLNPNTGNEFSTGGDIATGTDSAACSLIYATAAAHNPAWGLGNSFVTGATSTAAFRESPGPTITAQPVDTTVVSGSAGNFSITATGSGTLHYQWKKNGVNDGSDSSNYSISPTVNSDDLTTVQCVVTDDVGNTTSNLVYLRVVPTATEWLYTA